MKINLSGELELTHEDLKVIETAQNVDPWTDVAGKLGPLNDRKCDKLLPPRRQQGHGSLKKLTGSWKILRLIETRKELSQIIQSERDKFWRYSISLGDISNIDLMASVHVRITVLCKKRLCSMELSFYMFQASISSFFFRIDIFCIQLKKDGLIKYWILPYVNRHDRYLGILNRFCQCIIKNNLFIF